MDTSVEYRHNLVGHCTHAPVKLDFTERAFYSTSVVALNAYPGIRIIDSLVCGTGAAINAMAYKNIDTGAMERIVFKRITDDISPAPPGEYATIDQFGVACRGD